MTSNYTDEYLEKAREIWLKYHPEDECEQEPEEVLEPEQDIDINIDIPVEENETEHDSHDSIDNAINKAFEDVPEEIRPIIKGKLVEEIKNNAQDFIELVFNPNEKKQEQFMGKLITSMLDVINNSPEIEKEVNKLYESLPQADITSSIKTSVKKHIDDVKKAVGQISDPAVYGRLYDDIVSDIIIKKGNRDLLKDTPEGIRDLIMKKISSEYSEEIKKLLNLEIEKVAPQPVKFPESVKKNPNGTYTVDLEGGAK